MNRIIKGREQIVNKTFVKMMDELGYDVELTYKKKSAAQKKEGLSMLDNIPTPSVMTELLGQPLSKVWQALCSAIDRKNGMRMEYRGQELDLRI